MGRNNVFDYLFWRGDLDFEKLPFNEVDSLILSQLVYLPFENIVPSIKGDNYISLTKAYQAFWGMYDIQRATLGVLISDEIFVLLKKAATSVRFGGILLGKYENDIDTKTKKQFGAMTFILDKNKAYIAFRGTDDTLVGWREDFNMCFMCPVPSQRAAKEYVDIVATTDIICGKRLYLGGHSKGGNLAVYAGVYCNSQVRKRLEGIFNHDGPGFCKDVYESAGYREIRNRLKTTVPESSVVGMLLIHEKDYMVVKSCQKGILSHDAFSWEVKAKGFVRVNKISDTSRLLDRSLKAFIMRMSPMELEDFVDRLSRFVRVGEAKTLTDLLSRSRYPHRVFVRYLDLMVQRLDHRSGL